MAFVARAYAQDGTPAGELPIGEDALPQAESDPEGGWRYVYAGTLPWQSLPEEADRCSLCLTVEDPNTGTSYALESNTVPVEIYPLTEGEIQVTVYNETTIFEVPTVVPNDFYMTILLQQTLPAAEFESLTLPRAIAPEGAVFVGYAVHFGNPYDNGASQNAGADAFAFLLPGSDSETAEPVLTQQDVMRIPPAPDGVRYVNLHALWWVEENPSLLLDDGVSEVIQLNPYAFLYSEGFAYLDALPVPEREGYWFAGWYDEDGNPVHLLAYTDHCDPIYDENGNLEDYDWQSFHPITLVAHWVEQ